MSLGVTIGKFYPFHRGHERLIAAAAAQVERLVVIVGQHPSQELSGELRAGWIRERFPEVEVRLALEDIPNAPGPWAARTLSLLGRAPDLAFSSEDYGPAWAAAMGCAHVAVDPERVAAPCSGSALREDLGGHFAWLSAPARAHFARRVVVLGVESSGTTTLARELAAAYETTWVPEYGRSYWEGRRYAGEGWEPADFARIARGQLAAEDDLARRARRVLICDTDPIATEVWRQRYLGERDPALSALIGPRRRDLYLLTAPDFPFVQDGTRESEHLRQAMHLWFEETLAERGVEWALVCGSPAERLARARELIEPRLRFERLADPSAHVPAG